MVNKETDKQVGWYSDNGILKKVVTVRSCNGEVEC